MKLRKKLLNPFMLVGQGFVLGGILFFATHPASLEASASGGNPVESVLPAR
ncbi:hypothetical protein [Sphingosinicella terrae]|jgi:hypothetical protein|uniref:hypothetical protein n=1 Tax=Sphingosinicella terrae TaxID=2172047 RepID=UPI0013B38CBD|nr:hypothetical protein [Sphingosinicella terrae]